MLKGSIPLFLSITIAMTTATTCSAQQWLTPKMAPLSVETPVLIAGLQYNEQMLPKIPEKSRWYRIPGWFAGTWQRDQVKTTHEVDLVRHSESLEPVTEVCSSYDEEGWQRDGSGAIWNYERVPFRSEARGNGFRQVFLVRSIEPVEVNDKLVVKEFVGQGLVIEDGTGTIRHAARAKSVQSYRLLSPGLINNTSVTTEFDDKGTPTRVTETSCTLRRVREFAAMDYHHGKDIRAAFKTFICATNKPEWMPDATTIAVVSQQ